MCSELTTSMTCNNIYDFSLLLSFSGCSSLHALYLNISHHFFFVTSSWCMSWIPILFLGMYVSEHTLYVCIFLHVVFILYFPVMGISIEIVQFPYVLIELLIFLAVCFFGAPVSLSSGTTFKT